MNYITRSITPFIVEAIKYFPVIVITGPRQSGKSTLAKNIFPDFKGYNLEDLDIREIARTDPRAFLSAGETGMIIDEAQQLPELFSYIQGIVDNNPGARFVLTGSAQLSLLQSVTQSLAGRAAIFQLLPFAFDELTESMKNTGINNRLYQGLYPAVLTRDIPPTMYYANYTRTYIERDVRNILNIKDLDSFQRFMRMCAARIGSMFVVSDISNELGVSVNTVKSWISVLQASYIAYLLPPYAANIEKRLTKTSKIYFYDTGLAAYLLSIDSEQQMDIDKMRGHLFENYVITEAHKKYFNAGNDAHCYFYRDSNAVEVDLLQTNGEKVNLFEIKSSSTYHTDFEKNLPKVATAIKKEVETSAVIYTGDTTFTDKNPKILNCDNFYSFLNNK